MKKTKDETMSVPRRVRGVLEAKGQDHYEFTPFAQTGESSQVDVIGIGKDGTKTYLTTGQKPKRVAHLVVDLSGSPNPLDDLRPAKTPFLFNFDRTLK